MISDASTPDTQKSTPRKTFRVVLIKPSHYDNDGYVIQWFRSSIPSNTLATLYGIIHDAGEEGVLGRDVEIVIKGYDETNRILPFKQIIEDIKAAEQGVVCLIGVQSNQFPRAVDIGRKLRPHGIQVAIGGFHVSGCFAMLDDIPADIQEAMDLGFSLYSGECEGRIDEFLIDAWKGSLKPRYDYVTDLPDISESSIPILPENIVRRVAGHYTSFDSGRGCPFQCSFCTIINVQGRKSRRRSADSIERIIRANEAQNVRRYLLTDDNFARNKDWELILDRLISLKEDEGFRFKTMIQVDTLCHRTPNFIEKAARAGVHRVFIGLENINPDSLMGAGKRQNKIWEYRKMLQMWKEHRVLTYAGYILGFPGDTPESIRRDIEIIKKELPLDLVEFFILTPLPGSADHKILHDKGVWMEPDMNRYDLNYVTTQHDQMTDEELKQAYLDAWGQFYTDDHVRTIMRRGVASGLNTKKMTLLALAFFGSLHFEGVHPLEMGVFRRKVRRDRRPTLPLENPVVFYPRRIWEVLSTHYQWLVTYLRFRKIAKEVDADPNRFTYMDKATSPDRAEQEGDLEMMQAHQDKIQDPRKRQQLNQAS